MLMSCAEETAAGSSVETSSNTAHELHRECCQLIPKPSCVELACDLYLKT